jgi:putative ABC transport system permease protein
VGLDHLIEAAKLALDQLRANKFRSGLTVLGVVVGVATVMAMSAIIAGIRSSVMDEINQVGPRNFVVSRFDMTAITLTGPNPGMARNPPITLEEVRRLGQLDLLASTIPGFDLNRQVSTPGKQLDNVPIIARDAGWSDFTGGEIVAGSDFLPSDVRASRAVVVITQNLAEQLFGTLDPIGRQMRVGDRPFEVVGIFQPAANIFASIQQDYAVMPHTSAMKHLGVVSSNITVFIVPKPQADQDEAIDQVITTLRVMRGLRPSDPNNFAIMRQAEMADTFDRLTFVFFIVMIALSSIGLMVGGVGVIAIMMISVTERTREIGVRKALGATRTEIMWQFLIEAATLTVAGGALGLLLGGAGAWTVHALTPIPAKVPLWAIGAAVTMAAIAGIAFGLWPAWRAARMDPVVALRHE